MSEQLQLGTGRIERWAELDAKVVAALGSAVLSERDKEVLRVIAGHKGALDAIRAEEVARQAGMEWSERTRREIAGVVENAVLLFHIPIGGRRGKPCGYFLIVSANDLDLAIHPLWGEVYAHLRRLRALTSKGDVARLFGQAMLKLDSEKPKEVA